MSKVSIIIPARGEKYENLKRTLDSIQENATGEYEVIIGFDGRDGFSVDTPPLQKDFDYSKGDLKIIEFPSTVGIKTNINAMAAMATSKYIYKSDAHCRFSKGFDEILQQDMQEDWIVMPRFKIIKDDWSIQMRDGSEEFYDYFYLCCPFTDPKGFRFKAGGHWREKTDQNLNVQVDETPQIHGSGWFISKDRYFELGGFPNLDPYGHAQEPIWLALKNQLMGGKCMVNKNCWYAHLHQQGNRRGYHMDKSQENKSYLIAAEAFMKDPRMETWLEKNMPMPTWPENWRELLKEWKQNNT
jgi:glycosyltransferase involved in cell wall biosynthesis